MIIKDYHEAKKLSGEILKSETLPYNDHSQRIIDFLQERWIFLNWVNLKSYLIIILNWWVNYYRSRENKSIKECFGIESFDVNDEVVEEVKKHLNETSVENKELLTI